MWPLPPALASQRETPAHPHLCSLTNFFLKEGCREATSRRCALLHTAAAGPWWRVVGPVPSSGGGRIQNSSGAGRGPSPLATILSRLSAEGRYLAPALWVHGSDCRQLVVQSVVGQGPPFPPAPASTKPLGESFPTPSQVCTKLRLAASLWLRTALLQLPSPAQPSP